MTEFRSTQKKISDLEAQVKELTEKVCTLENPRRNTGGKPRPVHSPPREDLPPPPTREQIIADLKRLKAR